MVSTSGGGGLNPSRSVWEVVSDGLVRTPSGFIRHPSSKEEWRKAGMIYIPHLGRVFPALFLVAMSRVGVIGLRVAVMLSLGVGEGGFRVSDGMALPSPPLLPLVMTRIGKLLAEVAPQQEM